MTDYRYSQSNPQGGIDFWNDPAVWNTGVVPNAVDADVTLLHVTPGPNVYPRFLGIASGQSFIVRNLQIGNDLALDPSGTLSVLGAIDVVDGGQISSRGGVLETGSLTIAARGFLDADSQVDVSGMFTNAGTLDGIALGIVAGTIINSGTFIADQSEVPDSPSLTIHTSNTGQIVSNGTISQGTYIARGGNELDLYVGSPIVTDAAVISLGDRSTLNQGADKIRSLDPQTGTLRPIQATLQTIAPGGTLEVYANAFDGANTLRVDGSVKLAEAARLSESGVVVSPSGSIEGSGTIDASIRNDGLIDANLPVFGPLSSTTPALVEGPFSPVLLIDRIVTGSGSFRVGDIPSTDPTRDPASAPTLELRGRSIPASNFQQRVWHACARRSGLVHWRDLASRPNHGQRAGSARRRASGVRRK